MKSLDLYNKDNSNYFVVNLAQQIFLDSDGSWQQIKSLNTSLSGNRTIQGAWKLFKHSGVIAQMRDFSIFNANTRSALTDSIHHYAIFETNNDIDVTIDPTRITVGKEFNLLTHITAEMARDALVNFVLKIFINCIAQKQSIFHDLSYSNESQLDEYICVGKWKLAQLVKDHNYKTYMHNTSSNFSALFKDTYTKVKFLKSDINCAIMASTEQDILEVVLANDFQVDQTYNLKTLYEEFLEIRSSLFMNDVKKALPFEMFNDKTLCNCYTEV